MNIVLTVWKTFREKQFLQGIEVEELFSFSCDAASLTPSQREKLLKTGQALADPCVLMEPEKDPEGNRVHYLPWLADLNPVSMQPAAILEAWEADFDERSQHIQQRYSITI